MKIALVGYGAMGKVVEQMWSIHQRKTGEPWGLYAKWNKPVTKRQILYDSTYILEVVKIIETKSKIEVTRGRVSGFARWKEFLRLVAQ